MNRSRSNVTIILFLACTLLFATFTSPADDPGATARNIRLEIREFLKAANSSFEEGAEARALAQIDSVLVLDSVNPDAFFLQARIALAGGDTATAIGILDTACVKAPRSTRIKLLLARIYIKRGEYEMPLALTEEVLKTKPSDGEASFLHGWGLLLKGDTTGAADIFEKTLTEQLTGGRQ